MKLSLKKLGVALGLGLVATASQASPINIGGVVFDPDNLFDFSSNAQIVEVVGINPGDVIDGFGRVDNINGTNQGVFCPSGCEVTFEFGGYSLLSDLSAAGPGDPFAFTGGFLNVYVDASNNYDADDRSTALDGNLWLSLLAVDSTGANGGVTLSGNLNIPVVAGGLPTLTGDGNGYLDVTGGMAAGNFDTDSQFGGRDLSYTSSFQPLPSGMPTSDGYTHFGSADLAGNTIPEPFGMALFGAGLLGLAGARRRKRA